MKKISSIFIILTVVIVCSTSALAGENPQLNKLKRGLINIASSPLEIPKQTKSLIKDSKENDKAYNPVYIVSGLVKGFAYMVGRAGSGVWDIVTFNLAIPEDYGSLVKPEYINDRFGISKTE